MSGAPDTNVQTETVTETVTTADQATVQEAATPEAQPANTSADTAPAPKKSKAQQLLDVAGVRGFNEGVQAAYDRIAVDDPYTARFLLDLKKPEPDVG